MNVWLGSIVRLGTSLAPVSPPLSWNTGRPWPSGCLCHPAATRRRLP